MARKGPIERWTGKGVRWLSAYLFVMGMLLTAQVIYLLVTGTASVSYVIVPIAIMVPYVVIRARDPESTTIPLSGFINHQ